MVTKALLLARKYPGGDPNRVGGKAPKYATPSVATDFDNFASSAVVDGASDTLSDAGLLNIGPDVPALVGGIGRLDLDLNFASEALTGNASTFARWSDVSPTGVAPAVSGSLVLNDALTGSNETRSDGITDSAFGTVDGDDFSMTMDGSILGETTRRGVVLYFDNIADLGGGVGIATG